MSTIIEVTDALVARLNAGEFSQSFTAEREYQPVFDLAELRVSVVPKAVSITTASRHDSFYDCTVDVGIQKKVDWEAPGSRNLSRSPSPTLKPEA
ncbi:MAG: hypothetical protein KAY37_04680 [Phycisphaerae bacterium]|nr:hypothetical protein [Phycisphaerae bacterium]